jgi:molybdenum cofactor biosynthesis protein B
MSTRPNNYSFISQVVADEIDAKASRETRLRIVACPDRAAEPDKFVAQAFCVIRSVCHEASRLTVQGRLADTLDLGPPWPWRSRAGPDASRLTAAGHKLAAREIVTDDVEAIRAVVERWMADDGVDVVITTGGTGFAGRDVTPEAIEPLFEKRMDGFSIAFHMLSHAKIGTSTVQSRATAGVANATFIFCLPGSPGACRDAWDGILAAQLDYRIRPCNFVEIMPRLDEHLRRPKAQGASA